MIMSLSPLHCDEPGHVARVDPPADAKKKKKTRRGTRGARGARSKWKPWSELTWEERRDLDIKGAAKPQQDREVVVVSERKGGKNNRTVVVPVAPRLTNASINDEREAQRVLLARMLDVAKAQGWLADAKDISVEVIESMQGTRAALSSPCQNRSSCRTRLRWRV